VVPKEKNTLSTYAAEVRPGMVMVKVTTPARKGLCGPFVFAIEELASP